MEMHRTTPPRRPSRPGTLLAALVAAALVVAAAGCTKDAGTATARGGGELYVQGSEHGRVVERGGKQWMELWGGDGRTVWFDDRPDRRTGNEPTSTFVSQWAARGFTQDPPNATLQLQGDEPRSYVVELHDVALRGGKVAYQVAPLGGGPLPPAEFHDASLFIDDGGGTTSYVPATISFAQVQPGQQVALQVQNAYLSSGTVGAAGSGISVFAQSAPLPVSNLTVTSQQIALATSGMGMGEPAYFSVSVMLAVQPGETFSLRSASDPGVGVTAQIAGSEPQVVNQTWTLFPSPL